MEGRCQRPERVSSTTWNPAVITLRVYCRLDGSMQRTPRRVINQACRHNLHVDQPLRPSGLRQTLKIGPPTVNQNGPSATKLPQQGSHPVLLLESQQQQDHHSGRGTRAHCNTLCLMHHQPGLDTQEAGTPNRISPHTSDGRGSRGTDCQQAEAR